MRELEQRGVTYIGPRTVAVAVCMVCSAFTALVFGLDRVIGSPEAVAPPTASVNAPALGSARHVQGADGPARPIPLVLAPLHPVAAPPSNTQPAHAVPNVQPRAQATATVLHPGLPARSALLSHAALRPSASRLQAQPSLGVAPLASRRPAHSAAPVHAAEIRSVERRSTGSRNPSPAGLSRRRFAVPARTNVIAKRTATAGGQAPILVPFRQNSGEHVANPLAPSSAGRALLIVPHAP